MVNTLTKVITLLLFMNITLYIGLNLAIGAECGYDTSNCEFDMYRDTGFKLKGDIMDKMLQESLVNNVRSYRSNFTEYQTNWTESTFTTFPEKLGGEETATGAGISFLDMPNVVWDWFKTFFNIIVSPITLFTSNRLPFFFMALLGIPYMIMGVLASIFLFRGVGD